jgi:hypothetical protein
MRTLVAERAGRQRLAGVYFLYWPGAKMKMRDDSEVAEHEW